MEYYAKLTGSNEFFARRALYNCTVKLKRGDAFAAKKFYAVAALCLRSGGVSATTEDRILALKKIFEEGNNFASSAA